MTHDMHMEKDDLRILNALQDDLPLTHDPWQEIGKATGLSGEEVLKRVQQLTESGVIRSIGPTLESKKRRTRISTLIALQVPDERIKDVATIINEYAEVSHNFRREDRFNLWFTLSADSDELLDDLIHEILRKAKTEHDCLLNLRTIRSYKIDVRFPILHNTGEKP